ncbi:MAG: dephospho-CoA kinase [Lachnospiraceae bacterium]|nr:dephospho-CoA kinase [Lachnospiraceae bacterium]
MKQNKLLFIGITGGIGAGKSEILSYIRKHYKCEIYLADEVAHEVKRPGTECYRALVDLLGKEIINPDGQIDKARMAEKIFADASLLEKVNQLIHPAVKVYLLEHLEKARAAGEVELFFVEAALLIECGYGELVDEMWYIYADEQVRRERLKKARGYSEEKIENIMAKQLPEQKFRENCDFVIDNSGELADSYRQIDRKLEAFTWQE